MTLDALGIIDIRHELPTQPSAATRGHGKTSATVHYNGPPVGDQDRPYAGWLAHLIGIAEYHMHSAFGVPANGIQYNYAVLPSGGIVWLRDLDWELWHCAHQDGNRHSIAVHFPLGGDQAPTNEQWRRAEQLLDALGDEFGFDRQSVYAHWEWSPTSCPGPAIWQRLQRYRAGESTPDVLYSDPPLIYDIVRETPVRTAPDADAPIVQDNATGEPMLLQPGHRIEIDALVDGQWLHWTTGIGFVFVEDADRVGIDAVTAESTILHAPRTTQTAAICAILTHDNGQYTKYDISEVIVPAYFRICESVGVDPLIALAQMVHETDYLSSWWAARPRRNPAGIGVTGERGKGVSFDTWLRDGIPAHVGRLVAYALPPHSRSEAQQALVDLALSYRPLPDEYHGIAPDIAGLVGTWATDPEYASKIVRHAHALQGAN